MLQTPITDNYRVIDISFHTDKSFPPNLRPLAKERGFEIPQDELVAITTLFSKDRSIKPRIDYEFENIGASPEDIHSYFMRLAEADGITLEKVAEALLPKTQPTDYT